LFNCYCYYYDCDDDDEIAYLPMIIINNDNNDAGTEYRVPTCFLFVVFELFGNISTEG